MGKIKNKSKFDKDVIVFSKAISALGHPLRLSLYKYILENNSKLKKVSNTTLVKTFGYAQSTISEHINKLVVAQIVEARMEKTSTYYYANFAFVNSLLKQLSEHMRITKK